MTYFKVDDGVAFHPKMMRLSAEAVRAWVFAGSWSGRYLTDGFIPHDALAIIKGNDTIASELIEAGLWDEVDGGFQFHDWCEYQYSKEDIEGRRLRDREKKRKQRGLSLGDTLGESLGESPGFRGEGEGEGEGIGSLIKKDEKFAEFWDTYPRKAGKQAAQRAWKTAITKANPEQIIIAAGTFRHDPNREDQYTPHPATWLNQGRWDDEPLPSRQPVTKAEVKQQQRVNLIEWAMQQDQRQGEIE